MINPRKSKHEFTINKIQTTQFKNLLNQEQITWASMIFSSGAKFLVQKSILNKIKVKLYL